MKRFVLAVCLFAAACGSGPAPEPEKKAAVAPEPPKVSDHTSLFPPEGRVSTRVVTDHVLGNKALPGGSLGEYEAKGKKYQMFIVETDTAQKAAFLLLDVKGTLTDAAYIDYMGGYAGAADGNPIYVFAKKQYVAGIAGLPKEQADPLARVLAANLH